MKWGEKNMKNKKLEKELLALILTIVFCIIAVSIVLLILINTFNEKKNNEAQIVEKAPVVLNYNASIFYGGKVDIDKNLIKGYTIDNEMDFYSLFSSIEPAITNNDVSIFGFDDVVVEPYDGKGVPTVLIDDMGSIGFNMVAMLGSNTLSLGEEALSKSFDYWDQQTMYLSGGSREVEESTEIFTKNGINFGLLSYTMPSNLTELTIENPSLLDIYNDQKAQDDVINLKSQVDVVIVYMDWNDVETTEVTGDQKRVAKLLADAGADIILGTNTESIQPVQWIDDTIVYYSLGNLITNDTSLNQSIGLVGSLFIQKTVVDGVVTIEKSQPKADLIYITDSLVPRVMMFDELVDEIKNKDEVYNKYTSIITQLDDSIRVGGLK